LCGDVARDLDLPVVLLGAVGMAEFNINDVPSLAPSSSLQALATAAAS